MPVSSKWLGRIEYSAGLELQEKVVADIQAGNTGEQLLLLEHEPVYTIGRTRDQQSLKNPRELPHPVFETNRGGQATWHGPGQLVGYPILNLNARARDLHRYLRFLEDVLIRCCGEFGIRGARREGLTGVWIEDRKIASLGVGVRKWVTMHGFALNVENIALEAFTNIIPCGIAGVDMTSIERETERAVKVREVAEVVEQIFSKELDKELPCLK